MSPDQKNILHLIALHKVPGVGPTIARLLLDKLHSAENIFKAAAPALLETDGVGREKVQHILEGRKRGHVFREAEEELRFMEQQDIHAVPLDAPEFPPLLNHCPDGPLLLYVRGEQALNSPRCLSVVGTRRASSYGRDLCRALIKDLARAIPDLIIVSGLAYGIDAIAHRAALENGLKTVAILGHGLHTLYPASHRDLAQGISGQGALVTDFDSTMGPERNNFLRRNRIIAGWSRGTLVVESSERGGALTTATMALSYHREVMALPGRSTDARSVGCNNLIKRNMSSLISSASDILDLLGWAQAATPPQLSLPDFREDRPTAHALLCLLRQHPLSDPGFLCLQSGLPIQDVLASLLQLELEGLVGSEAGNRYRALP